MATIDPFLHIWDEQFHALVAKNLINNPFKPVLRENPVLYYDFKNWPDNNIWLHKQPLFMWQMALSMKLFGINELSLRIPSIIMHAFLSIITFRVGWLITNNIKVGFLSGLFFTFAHYPLELLNGFYSTDHNDITFLFYITCSFWAWFEYQNKPKIIWLVLIGLFSGFAILTKWLVGLLVYLGWGCCILFNLSRQSKLSSFYPFLLSLLITIIVALPWQIYVIHNFPLEALHEYEFNSKHLFEVIENHTGGYFFHLDALKEIYFDLGIPIATQLIILISIIFIIIKTPSKEIAIMFFISIFAVFIFYSFAATKMLSYTVIVLPFIIIAIANGVEVLLSALSRKMNNNRINHMFTLVVLLGILFTLLNPSKIKLNHSDIINRESELNHMKLVDYLKNHYPSESIIVFNTNVFRYSGQIPIMFYTQHIAYDIIPTEAELIKAKATGLEIAIIRNENQLPDYIEKDPLIVKINL